MTNELNEAIRQRDRLFKCLMFVRRGVVSGNIKCGPIITLEDMNGTSMELKTLQQTIDEAFSDCGYKLIDPPKPEKKKRKSR